MVLSLLIKKKTPLVICLWHVTDYKIQLDTIHSYPVLVKFCNPSVWQLSDSGGPFL